MGVEATPEFRAACERERLEEQSRLRRLAECGDELAAAAPERASVPAATSGRPSAELDSARVTVTLTLRPGTGFPELWDAAFRQSWRASMALWRFGLENGIVERGKG